MSNRNPELLLVEDDSSLGYLLSEYLKMKDFEMNWARTGKRAKEILEMKSPDLVILDVMLPDLDGFDLASQIKHQHPELPFIFLTARSLKTDVLKGFDAGAVDYLRKPIDEEELVARIKGLLSKLLKPEFPVLDTHLHKIGNYTFNSRSQQLCLENEKILLTGRECELLLYLVTNRNNLCTHKDILTRIWGKSDYFNRKSLNVFISHLRKYLCKDPAVKIENLHRKGFMLRVE